jgi:hypothetical protein
MSDVSAYSRLHQRPEQLDASVYRPPEFAALVSIQPIESVPAASRFASIQNASSAPRATMRVRRPSPTFESD